MNLSGLWDTIRSTLGQVTGKPASPALKTAAPPPAPVSAPRPAPAPVPPRPAPVAATAPAPAPGPAAATPTIATSATLARPVRAGGRLFAPGTVVKVVTIHGKGTAYTVQVPGLSTSKTIEGAAIRIG